MLDLKIEDGHTPSNTHGATEQIQTELIATLTKLEVNQSFVVSSKYINHLRKAVRTLGSLENNQHSEKVFTNNKAGDENWRCFRVQ